ncbi:MAG: ROK family protein [Bacillota bacterium]
MVKSGKLRQFIEGDMYFGCSHNTNQYKKALKRIKDVGEDPLKIGIIFANYKGNLGDFAILHEMIYHLSENFSFPEITLYPDPTINFSEYYFEFFNQEVEIKLPFSKDKLVYNQHLFLEKNGNRFTWCWISKFFRQIMIQNYSKKILTELQELKKCDIIAIVGGGLGSSKPITKFGFIQSLARQIPIICYSFTAVQSMWYGNTKKTIVDTFTSFQHVPFVREQLTKKRFEEIGISAQFAPNIEIWEDIALKKKLNQEFDCQVSVENAVNAAVLGEKWQGKLNGCKNEIYLKLDKGIGAGILINNSLYRGGNSIAGEVGYMVSDKEYISSQKNGYGSLESVCSTKFIVKKAEKILGKDNISFEVVIDEIKKGNKKLNALIEEINELIAVAIANIICVINPEKVVLGGEFTEIAQSYKTDIMEIISRIVPSVPKLIFSELGNKVFYLGAIVQGLENIEENLVYQYFEKTN